MPNAGEVSAVSLIACALEVLSVQCAGGSRRNDADFMPAVLDAATPLVAHGGSVGFFLGDTLHVRKPFPVL